MENYKKIQITRNQHFVPRKYLKKWCFDGTFLYQTKVENLKTIPVSTKAICYEKDFYKWYPLSRIEKALIISLFEKTLEPIKTRLNSMFEITDNVFKLNENNPYLSPRNKAALHGLNSEETSKLQNSWLESKKADEILVQMGEEGVSDTEKSFTTIMWDKICNKKFNFTDKSQELVDFISYLFFQMWRTPKGKRKFSKFVKDAVLSQLKNGIFSQLIKEEDIDANHMYPYFLSYFSGWQAINAVYNRKIIVDYVQSDNENLYTSDYPCIPFYDDEFNIYNLPYAIYWPLCPTIGVIINFEDNRKIRLDNPNDVVIKNADSFFISKHRPKFNN